MVKSLKISKLAVTTQTNLLMEIQPLDQLTKIINDALNGTAKLHKSFQTFFITTSILFLSMTKRKNFTQMALFSNCCESRFRQNFQKKFDWVRYNLAYCREKLRHRIAIAIDPSYIPKSGKHTPGTGYFWSGSASAAKWGLEILGIALVDADDRDAIHLRAVQTVDTVSKGRPPKYLAGMDDPNSLLAWYLKVIASQKEALLEVCKTIVADAYFSKKPFVDGLIALGFNLISRFRSDVRLRYLYDGPKTGKRGRPKVYGDKVDIKNPDMNVFVGEDITSDDKVVTLYSAVVWSVGLKRKVKVVIVDCLEPGKKTQERKVFFSTDTSMSAKDIMDIYRTRFQIEYLYRDAKQFTGLAHCQSRKKESLDFAFNMSLSSINLARAFARSCGVHLSVSNVKTLIHNADMIQRFIRMSGKRPHRLLNTNDFKELLYYGVSDAA